MVSDMEQKGYGSTCNLAERSFEVTKTCILSQFRACDVALRIQEKRAQNGRFAVWARQLILCLSVLKRTYVTPIRVLQEDEPP
jgi:hypothetical protein